MNNIIMLLCIIFVWEDKKGYPSSVHTADYVMHKWLHTVLQFVIREQ